MLQAVNWSEKLGQIFGGHRGRVLRILILFLCALAVLIGVYRSRSARLEKEKLRREKPLLKIHAASLLPAASTAKWVIVGNPDEDEANPFRNGADYVCSVASVARDAGWKSVIIGPKLDCCIMPDCYPINRTQFLRMNYRTAAILKNLTETGSHPQSYKEAVRNIAFLWVIHRGARWVFDAYVEEYQSANVTIPRFEEELTRQLHTLALDESLALVQERGRSRGALFRNPYSHFGRPDVRLVPNGRGSGVGTNSHAFHHASYHHYATTLNLAHGPTGTSGMMGSHKYQDFPTFRICEVRPPHIEKVRDDNEYDDDRHAASLLPAASTAKWVIVGNPDEDEANPFRNGADYVCSVASVARDAGWKSVIIGPKLDCCIMPDCYPINRTQFLRMNYRTAAILKNLTETGSHPQSYKEAVRNIAFLWVIHRGARWVFDAYVEEYQSANVTIPRFEEELTRQLHTLALDESLALVQERGRSRGALFRNPYSHFGRPDVRLVPNGRGSGVGTNSHAFHHASYHHYATTLNLAHGPTGTSGMMGSHKYQDFPTFRICEVRPPHIEKFLEIDEGWWDLRAPALVLPGDNMPPLCTRNTLFSPEVFWALPLLPDYSRDDFEEHALESPNEDVKDGDADHKSSRIPPWYIRGLWSQSLLGDLGGSIRLTLSRVPTLQMNKDYFAGGDYEQNPVPNSLGSNGNGGSLSNSNNRTGSSKLLKRWHCRSRSTFRCLLLMSKELSKSIFPKRNDLSLIEAWIVDLKNIHYMEPPMLPRRRSHTNPCLGADGLHGVSFYPSLEPNQDLTTEEFIGKRNDTFKELIVRLNTEDESSSQRDKRETERPTLIENSGGDEIVGLLPPEENSTYSPNDWSTHISEPVDLGQDGHEESSYVTRPEDRTLSPYDSHYRRYKPESHPQLATSQPTERPSRIDYYHPDILPDQSGAYRRRGFPVVDKSSYLSDPRAAFLSASRSAKHLHEALAKHHEASVDGFPILKAMTETMCPGFGSLVPYQPAVVQSDVLLIIAFTNHHYDLIPSLEVLYRSSFPNMLYCGNPHESIDLFLRKYQSVEHRSFSFLPTYTRATYECVLGAMEMNYEVKGYVVITDETLIKTWNIEGLDKTKIWVSSSDHENRHVPVTKESWPKLDPRGQKLPRLLDGLANTWKMLTYFLVGQDTYILEPATIKKRSVDAVEAAAAEIDDSENATVVSNPTPVTEPPKDENVSAEKLETLETSYVPVTGGLNRISQLSNRENSTTDEADFRQEYGGEERQPKSDHQQWDLSGDWGDVNKNNAPYARIPLVELDEGQESSNETFSGIDETTDDVEVGEDDDETTSSDVSDLIKDSISETPSSSPNPNDQVTDEMEGVMLVTPTSEAPITENSTDSVGAGNISVSSDTGAEQVISTTPIPESSIGVPLYHVEHVEPPTPPTYHKPEEVLGAGLERDVYNVSMVNSSLPEETSLEGKQSEINKGANTAEEEKPLLLTKSSDYVPTTEKGIESESSTSTTTTASTTALPPSPGYGLGSEEVIINDSDNELKREMEILLDGLKKVYLNLVGTVQDYQEMNDTDTTSSHDKPVIGKEILEDLKSHRISPREFRHIRCTMQDDGHQSELCSILRAYVNKLLLNLGTDIHLYHDTIPMYYLPSSATKPFYSVANVLLHHGVMDELALPLLFRGLAPESDWIKLVRSPALDLSASEPATAGSGHTQRQSGATGEDMSSQVLNSKSEYLHPFHLHKVYSDHDLRNQFCKHYLLRIFEM